MACIPAGGASDRGGRGTAGSTRGSPCRGLMETDVMVVTLCNAARRSVTSAAMPRTLPTARRCAAALAASVLALPLISSGGAAGDPIGDKRAEAAAVAGRSSMHAPGRGRGLRGAVQRRRHRPRRGATAKGRRPAGAGHHHPAAGKAARKAAVRLRRQRLHQRWQRRARRRCSAPPATRRASARATCPPSWATRRTRSTG